MIAFHTTLHFPFVQIPVRLSCALPSLLHSCFTHRHGNTGITLHHGSMHPRHPGGAEPSRLVRARIDAARRPFTNTILSCWSQN